MDNSFDEFDDKAVLRILLSIYQKDKNISSIVDDVEGVGFNKINKLLTTLEELGLVYEKESPYRIREFTLTTKGRGIAEQVLKLKAMLEDEEE